MRPNNIPLLALPALLCVLVEAIHVPSIIPLTLSASSTPTWRRLTNNLVDSIWPHPKPEPASPSYHSSKTDRHARFSPPARHGGDLVLRFNLSTSEEAASLIDAADTLLLDIWEFSHEWVDVRLSVDIVSSLLGLLPPSLTEAHIPLLRERDLAQAIRDTYPAARDRNSNDHRHNTLPSFQTSDRQPFSPTLGRPAGAGTNIFFSEYQPLSVIEPWMRLLSSLFTTHVRQINIGLSYQGRNIPGLRIGVHPTNDEDPSPSKRKTLLIVGGSHAREWISTSTVNYIAYSLATGYGKSPLITSLLEAFDFVLVPTLNPDGYVYTWDTDRLWRKNRQLTNIRFCPGLDLDHAFGFEWDTTSNPCSESFAGDVPFEATEAKRLADWAKNETEHNNVEFVGFLDLHSYSQQILYPYSYSCRASPPGQENLEELAAGMRKAIRISQGHDYEVMSACEGNVVTTTTTTLAGQTTHRQSLLPRIESAGGSALDFFYHTIGVRYAYQIKLRDRGSYGFLLPSEHIVPTGQEIFNAVLYYAGFLSELYTQDHPEAQLSMPDMDDDVSDSPSSAHLESTLDAVDKDADDEATGFWSEQLDPEDIRWDLKRRKRK